MLNFAFAVHDEASEHAVVDGNAIGRACLSVCFQSILFQVSFDHQCLHVYGS